MITTKYWRYRQTEADLYKVLEICNRQGYDLVLQHIIDHKGKEPPCGG